MLQIVKASAGSGKTHKLTEEYINLLFKNEENYKHILAITFTHKATEEMKSRIIRKLDEYSRTSSSKEKQEKSRKLLSSILFDYDMFHISTIDSFFQSIVRSFVRETGLQHGYGVELESKIVLEEAVDRLIMGLDRDTSSSVLKHMIDFAKARAKEGESWNIRKEMHTLAMELDRENYKLYAEVLQRVVSEEDYLTNYIEILKRIINKKKQTIRSLCNRAIAIIEQTQWGITSKNDWRNVFYKAKREDIFEPNKTQQEKLSSPSSWVTRTMKKEEKEKAQEAISLGLDKIALELLGELSHSTEYISALLIRKQIYIVGLLSDINEEKNILGKETNSFLLSDTTHFLQLITQDSDVPFIYEKTGVHIDHYMLDEFQDTSLMQWNSLSPLIHDCLDQSNECLIVGDVKQSIYRWRNSDSSLMGEKIAKEFSGYKMSTPSLKENYRSGANIVEFNNTFFEGIANKLREEIKNTYPSFQGKFLTSSYGEDDLKQQSASKDKGGYVGITFLSNKKEEQERTKALEKLKEIIDDLLNRNYPYSDIVILIRNKAEAEIIIDYFSHVEG
ncbi:MAG TPA: hypothetical protein DDY68_03100, partial [Porphyromonadaceae bacterium]|nr:hypothetical protein [Porphyromonadaceae bacterium]